jgi:hypothetical protein
MTDKSEQTRVNFAFEIKLNKNARTRTGTWCMSIAQLEMI